MKKKEIMKKAVCLGLSLFLTCTCIPVNAMAQDIAADEQKVQSVDLGEEKDQNQDVKETKENLPEQKDELKTSEEETNKTKVVSEENQNKEIEKNTEKAARMSAYIYDVDYEQKEINKKNITVSIKNIKKLMQLEAADEVKVEVKMLYKGKTIQSAKHALKIKDVAENGEFNMKMPTYGKYYVTTTFLKNGKVVNTTSKKTVGVTAKEYNFAALNATFPVVQFTLSLWNMKGDTENPVPTFVSLSRNDAYDWGALPENVYELPYINSSNRTSVGFSDKIDMTAHFIKELYELNPDSKFNLYSVDYTLSSYLYTIIQNKIPADQYSVRILSDGTASYTFFNERFNNNKPQTVYNAMAKEWNKVRSEYAKGNKVPLTSLKYGTQADTSSLKYYTYVIANEEKKKGVDIEWWLARTNGTLLSGDEAFLKEACKTVDEGGVIRQTAFNSMLKELTNKGEAVQSQFKKLYHFSSTMFQDAEKNHKKVMMLLGTRVTGEENFEDYARFCMLYYGDKYEYYYKGHPATPTAMYPEKQAQLKSLGMHDVESSIAAELILYFYPNISMSGYDSTTFISASKDMACCLFNKTLEDAYNVTNGCDYKNTIDFCISKLTNYSKYDLKDINEKNNNYLIEFNKVVEKSAYKIGVWDATDACIYYYKLKDGKYVLAKKERATKPMVSAKGGQNQITLTWGKVSGADLYKVYKYDSATKKYKCLKTLKGTKYVAKKLKNGTKYQYLVRARVKGTWSKYNTTNHAIAYTTPSKPKVHYSATSKSIKLSWKAVKSAKKYRVYAYDVEKKAYTKLEDTTKTSVKYNNLKPGSTHIYLVRSWNETDFSPSSRTDNVKTVTLCETPKVVSYADKNSVTLTWGSVSGAASYRIYKYNTSTGKCKAIASVNKNSYTIKKLKSGTSYAYLVRAYNGKAYSKYSKNDAIICKTACAAPKVKAKQIKKTVKLNWKQVKGAQKYQVYMYQNKQYKKIADVTGTKYTTDNLKRKYTYRFIVRAYNGTVLSNNSNIVSVTIK